jgi:hypothetical protein
MGAWAVQLIGEKGTATLACLGLACLKGQHAAKRCGSRVLHPVSSTLLGMCAEYRGCWSTTRIQFALNNSSNTRPINCPEQETKILQRTNETFTGPATLSLMTQCS